MSHSTLENDLKTLLGDDFSLPALSDDLYLPASEFAKRVVESSTGPVPMSELRDLRADLMNRYSSGRIGSLMSERILNREEQFRTLSRIGPEAVLDMMAEGLLLPRIAKRLEISYQVLTEFMQLTTTPEQVSKARALGADMMIDNALEDFESKDLDREEISRRGKMLDTALKVGKIHSDWVEKKDQPVVPPTLIQNNFTMSDSPEQQGQPVHGFQLILSDDLPPLKPLAIPVDVQDIQDEYDQIENGEFYLVPEGSE